MRHLVKSSETVAMNNKIAGGVQPFTALRLRISNNGANIQRPTNATLSRVSTSITAISEQRRQILLQLASLWVLDSTRPFPVAAAIQNDSKRRGIPVQDLLQIIEVHNGPLNKADSGEAWY